MELIITCEGRSHTLHCDDNVKVIGNDREIIVTSNPFYPIPAPPQYPWPVQTLSISLDRAAVEIVQ